MVEAWQALRNRPLHIAVLVLCAAVVVAHQATRWDWMIDDAAICFSYARNLVAGEGIVPWPGGERVEGVSDPTWILLLAVFQAVGIDGFMVAKPLGMLLAVLCLPVAWDLARRALPDHTGPGALVAPAILAMNAQFAIWSASGLENALFCLLLALALRRTLIDVEEGGVPWASVWYLLLVWTRPEAAAYAAIGGAFLFVGTWRAGRSLRAVWIWVAIIAIPTLILEALRWWYFAWPLPNTFYAKLENRGVRMDWNARGWRQLRTWAQRLWHGWYVPLYVVGITGTTGWRARAGLGAVALVALSLLWPGPDALRALSLWPELPAPPDGLVLGRTATIVATAVGIPLLLASPRAPTVRSLCGLTFVFGLGFAVAVDGDWMGGYRFMSLVAVPGSVVLACGLVETVDWIERRATGGEGWGQAGWLAAAFGVGLLIPPNLNQIRDHRDWNKNESPGSVKQRVDHTRAVLRRTLWEEPVVTLEVDQGAHLWWAPDYRSLDMAMLVDVAMGRHWYQQRAFIQEYVFDENPPTFAHVGGWWAKYTGLRRYQSFEDHYFELPRYWDRYIQRPFPNVYARRDLVLAPAETWTASAVRPRFGDVVVLERVPPPPPWVPGEDAYLEVALSLARPLADETLQMVAFLHAEPHGVVASWDLPLGYGLIPPGDWRPGEVFRGRHVVPVPPQVPPGRFTLGLVLLLDGAVVAAEGSATDRMAVGEYLVEHRPTVETVDQREAYIDQRRTALLSGDVDCDASEAQWVALKRSRPRAWKWHAEERPAAARHIATCWAREAERRPDEAPELLARAHWWDHWAPELARVGEPVGTRLYAEGRAAREAGDWELAYDRFSRLLRFQPWRSWARRWAEEARDERLGLTDDVRIGIGGENDLRDFEEAQRNQGAPAP